MVMGATCPPAGGHHLPGAMRSKINDLRANLQGSRPPSGRLPTGVRLAAGTALPYNHARGVVIGSATRFGNRWRGPIPVGLGLFVPLVRKSCPDKDLFLFDSVGPVRLLAQSAGHKCKRPSSRETVRGFVLWVCFRVLTCPPRS